MDLHSLMEPLYNIVSLIMLAFYKVFTGVGLSSSSGLTWLLSIIGLVLVIRTALIPLYVKQIKAQRAMQLIQPEIKKIQEKYKHDKQKQTEKLMELYKERKTNPFTSCLPMLAQSPVLFALFGVLNGISNSQPRGTMTQELVDTAKGSHLLGAELFQNLINTSVPQTRVLAILLVILMTATTFIQQRQLITKNMPESALTGNYAQQQKFLMYAMPFIFGITGLWFPVGVLVYWFVSNLWSLGQQVIVIRKLPAPGSLAEKKLQQRREMKDPQKNARTTPEDSSSSDNCIEPSPNVAESSNEQKRQQPKRQSRQKRR